MSNEEQRERKLRRELAQANYKLRKLRPRSSMPDMVMGVSAKYLIVQDNSIIHAFATLDAADEWWWDSNFEAWKAYRDSGDTI
jgi:hypothetical protein